MENNSRKSFRCTLSFITFVSLHHLLQLSSKSGYNVVMDLKVFLIIDMYIYNRVYHFNIVGFFTHLKPLQVSYDC